MIDQDISAYESNNIYEFDNSIMMHYYPHRIRQILGNRKVNSCLELGIGHGYTAELFSQYFRKYVVLDGDDNMIKRFKERFHVETEIIRTYFEDWDTEEKFDIIIAGFVLEHVDCPLLILKKYKQFLKENGSMFITVPNAEALNRRIGFAGGILKDIKELSVNDLRCGHKRYYTVESIKEECFNAGLKVKRIEGIFLKPITTKQMIDLNLSEDIIKGLLEVGKEYPELSLGLLLEVSV